MYTIVLVFVLYSLAEIWTVKADFTPMAFGGCSRWICATGFA